MQKRARLFGGEVTARIVVERGRIRAVQFGNDFTNGWAAVELAEYLVGVRYDRRDLLTTLQDALPAERFGMINPVDFVDFLY